MRLLYGAPPPNREDIRTRIVEGLPKATTATEETIANMKARVKEIERQLAMVPSWKDELAMLKRMLKAAKAAPTGSNAGGGT